MAKKKFVRRQRKPAVRIEGVLESVTDELAAVIGVLHAVSKLAPGGLDEIAEWAKATKVRLEDDLERADAETPGAPAAAAPRGSSTARARVQPTRAITARNVARP